MISALETNFDGLDVASKVHSGLVPNLWSTRHAQLHAASFAASECRLANVPFGFCPTPNACTSRSPLYICVRSGHLAQLVRALP